MKLKKKRRKKLLEKARKKSKKATKNKHVKSDEPGLIKCAKCGQRMKPGFSHCA